MLYWSGSSEPLGICMYSHLLLLKKYCLLLYCSGRLLWRWTACETKSVVCENVVKPLLLSALKISDCCLFSHGWGDKLSSFGSASALTQKERVCGVSAGSEKINGTCFKIFWRKRIKHITYVPFLPIDLQGSHRQHPVRSAIWCISAGQYIPWGPVCSKQHFLGFDSLVSFYFSRIC